MPQLKQALDAAIDISNFLGSHAWFRKLVHDKQKLIFGRVLEICSHVRHYHHMIEYLQCPNAATTWFVLMQVETRFGSRVMVCRDVMDSAEALQRAVNDPGFQINDAGAQVCKIIAATILSVSSLNMTFGTHFLQEVWQHITDFSFVESLQSAVRMLEPILALLQSLEQDKPLLSQCLPAWYSVYQHLQSQAEANLQCYNDMRPVLRKRFVDKCYHPAMAAAFVVDPVYYKEDSAHTKFIPDDAFIEKMESTLGIDIWKDARKVMYTQLCCVCYLCHLQKVMQCCNNISTVDCTDITATAGDAKDWRERAGGPGHHTTHHASSEWHHRPAGWG